MITTCLALGLGLLVCLWTAGLISYAFKLTPKATGNVIILLVFLAVLSLLLSLA